MGKMVVIVTGIDLYNVKK